MSHIGLPLADLSASRAFRPPVAGMAYYNFFDQGRASLARNLAPGGAAVMQGGIPTFGPGHAVFAGPGQYIDVQISHAPGMNWFVVAKTPTANTSTVAGAYMTMWDSAGGNPAGFGLFPRTDGVRGYGVSDNAGVAVNLSRDLAVDEMAWRFLELRIDNEVPGLTTMLVRDWTANVEASQTVAYNARTHSRRLRIGAGYPASATAVSHINFAAAISDVLSDTDALKIYENARAVAALRGIAV